MRFKNTSGSTQELPTLGEAGLPLRVPDGEEFEASGDAAKSLQANPSFERVDSKPTKSEKE